MTGPSRFLRRFSLPRAAAAAIVLTLIAPLTGAVTGSLAQTMSDQQLVEKLLGKSTRSMSGGVAASSDSRPATADVRRLRELLQMSGTRAFTAKERIEVAEAVKERPSLDFEVYFPFNSSALQPSALDTVHKIGQLLTNPAFEGRSFLITGHTDAKGKAEPNRVVSERRAEAVKAYLVKTYAIDPLRLRVIGYGKEQLKAPDKPFSAINRRVQIINLPDGAVTASR